MELVREAEAPKAKPMTPRTIFLSLSDCKNYKMTLAVKKIFSTIKESLFTIFFRSKCKFCLISFAHFLI